MNTQKRIVLSTTWNNLRGRDGVIGSNVLQCRALQPRLPNAYFIRVKVLKVKRNATALQTFFNSLKQSAYRVLKKRYVYDLQLAELPFVAFCASTLAARKDANTQGRTGIRGQAHSTNPSARSRRDHKNQFSDGCSNTRICYEFPSCPRLEPPLL